MNWIDLTWPMVSAACATLGAIHLGIWFRQRDRPANLAFAVSSVSLAVIVILELLMMRAGTPHEYAKLLRWAYVPITALAIGLVAFLLLQFRAGSRRLGVASIVARVACLGLNFATGESVNYLRIPGLRQLSVWGGGAIVMPSADAIPNPWGLVDNLADVLLILFIVSVIVGLLRRPHSPERRRALMISWATLLFVIFAFVWPLAVLRLGVHGPLMISPVFLLLMVAMANELGVEAFRSRTLERSLSAAELDLVNTRRQMDMAVHAADVGLWNWDMVTGDAWFSDVARSVLGYPPGDAIDAGAFRARISPGERGRFDAMLRDAHADGGAFTGEYRIQYPDGGTCWVISRGEVEFGLDGTPLRVDAAIVDISARKAAEDRFRMVVEAAPVAMLMFDPDGTIALANAQAESLFGFTIDELVGMQVAQVMPGQSPFDGGQHSKPDGSPEAIGLAAGGSHELRGRRKDRSDVPIRVTLSPIPFGSRLSMLTTILDMSEKDRFERELAIQRDELAHLSRVTLLAELSGSLAHELNQPLTAVLANAQAAVRFLARDPPDLEEVRTSLMDIVESDKRAGEVIRRLRALLRKDRTEFRPLDINDVIHGVLKIIRSDLLNKQIETRLELAADLPAIHGDAVQLQQVLLNLIVNASDAMRDVDPRELTLRTVLDERGRIVVSVSDVGQGMPSLDPETIFTPFFTTKPNGLGLGLPVCRTIITAHEGELWAANNVGVGATVSFSLSVDSDRGVSPVEVAQASATAG